MTAAAYKARRAAGLCEVCTAPSPTAARCDGCAESLNASRRVKPGHPAVQYSQAIRVIELVRVLQSSRTGLCLEAIAERMGVTVRTVRRGLECLRAAQVPFAMEAGVVTLPAHVVPDEDRREIVALALALLDEREAA